MTVYFLGGRMAAADMRACCALLEAAEPGSPFERLLRRKLHGVAPAADGGVDPLVVTINSRVEFRVDDEVPQTRILVRNRFQHGLVGLTLPITTPRGMALLGLREGQSFAFEEGGRVRTITVCRIAYQPQAARSGRRPDAAAQASQAEIVSLEEVRAGKAPVSRKGRSSDRRSGI